jgi:1-acyl-sn-glycerol-3-phosphate acyltransferase
MIRQAWGYAVLSVGIALFAAVCFAWALVAWVLWPLPARWARPLGRRGAMLGFRFYLAIMEALGAFRLDLEALDRLRGEGALIVAPNHPGLLDAVLMVSRMPDAVCVMKTSLLGYFLLAPASRLARYVPNDSLRKLLPRASLELQAGAQLLLFPEGTRTVGTAPIGPLTDAVGAISRRAQVPVQAVLIEMSAPLLAKGRSSSTPPQFPVHIRVRLGRRFEPPKDVRAFTEELDRHFRRELAGGAAQPAESASIRPAVEDAPQVRG